MAFFRRDKSKPSPAETGAEPQVEQAPARTSGPYDRSEVDGDGGRLDLGGLLVPGVEGMEMRLELDQVTGDVTAVSCLLRGSALQLQGFAAPRTLGIWDDIRDEIAQGIERAGGAAEVVDGVHGTELAVQMPTGPGQFAPARFLGVDGPRWFLRGFLSGPAAAGEDPETASTLLAVFSQVVVVRGDEAMAPRELLPLRLPDVAQADTEMMAEDDPGARSTDDLQPFERGPEITETR